LIKIYGNETASVFICRSTRPAKILHRLT